MTLAITQDGDGFLVTDQGTQVRVTEEGIRFLKGAMYKLGDDEGKDRVYSVVDEAKRIWNREYSERAGMVW